MRLSYKLLFGLYLSVLLWLLLFKFSYDIVSVIEHHQARSVNLIPFAGLSSGNAREMIENVIVFIPLGLLFSINIRSLSFWYKLGVISLISLAVETFQFILGIGITDVTDLITNMVGGLIGLALYNLAGKYVSEKVLHRCAAGIIFILLAAVLFLRFFVVRVRY
jgi:glycopeptide antibiotics resistance protein